MVKIDGDGRIFRSQGFLRQFDRALCQGKRPGVLSGSLKLHHPFAEFENVVRLLSGGRQNVERKGASKNPAEVASTGTKAHHPVQSSRRSVVWADRATPPAAPVSQDTRTTDEKREKPRAPLRSGLGASIRKHHGGDRSVDHGTDRLIADRQLVRRPADIGPREGSTVLLVILLRANSTWLAGAKADVVPA